MYDLIGDIHGHAEPLKRLLHKMQYHEKDGVWQHPSRKAIFVGDYIDRGPAIREVLHIIHGMVQGGQAIALMGNHEYNALAYHYQLPDGAYIRKHTPVHDKQHEQTMLQFADYPQEWASFLKWFYTLPLFLDLPELRAVHACWDQLHVNWLSAHGYTTINEEFLVRSGDRSTYEYEVIEDLLKGKEYNIPEQYSWSDKDGHTRMKNRLKWWLDAKASTFGNFLFDCPEPMQQKIIEEHIDYVIYPKDAKPIFFGHYWLEDNFPLIQSDNVVCLDYSIAKGGNLVAYRWKGESKLDNSHFVSVAYKEEVFL